MLVLLAPFFKRVRIRTLAYSQSADEAKNSLGTSERLPAPLGALATNIRELIYSSVSVKPIEWLGSSRRDVQAFPTGARQVAGFQLYRVQRGLDPNDWKPIPTVGSGVKEIRIRTGREHRVLYTARFADAIYVLHAFEKKTQKTPKRELTVARERLRALLNRKRRHDASKA